MYTFVCLLQEKLLYFLLSMIIVFGKGKVGLWLSRLLTLLKKDFVLMDDADLDSKILESASIILPSPWIKQSHYIYQKYSQKIKSELEFLSTLLPSLWLNNSVRIGITGTNWKSTTTWIAYKVFQKIFPEKKIWITGNFEIPVSEVLAEIVEQNVENDQHVFVVEASSFMLYKLKDFFFDFSILLNIARDHLDWHKDFNEYQDSKLNLLRQTKKKFFVPESEYLLLNLKENFDNWIATKEEFDLSMTKFLWKHNQINISVVESLVLEYSQSLGINVDFIKKSFFTAIADIEPLPHRLGLLRQIDDIKIYDDWICTSAHSLSVALSSFSSKVVLIAGGYDKWDDYSVLEDFFVSKVWFAVLIGEVSLKLQKICEENQISYLIVKTLKEAVESSYKYAKEKWLDQILFSPGAASFDMFKNVYDRVEQFEKIVSEL